MVSLRDKEGVGPGWMGSLGRWVLQKSSMLVYNVVKKASGLSMSRVSLGENGLLLCYNLDAFPNHLALTNLTKYLPFNSQQALNSTAQTPHKKHRHEP